MTERARLGMLLSLIAEAVFFLMLLIALVYFREAGPAWPSLTLDARLAAGVTAVLLASTFSMWRAGAGNRLWLALTGALGVAFLVGLAMEWQRLIERGLTISKNTFAAALFTVTGFHALHLAIGIVLVAILLGLSRPGRRGAAVRAVAPFWHFASLVWIAILAILYVWFS